MLSTQPTVEQTIDVMRPHTLVGGDVRVSGSLTYRYDDDLSRIEVPNTWPNQPYWARTHYLNWLAEKSEAHAQQLLSFPPLKASRTDADLLAKKYAAYADRIRAEAKRLNAAARHTHPVAASRLELNFGPHPGSA